MKILALCLNIQELQDRPEDLSNSRRYPGSGYLPHLVRLARERGYEVMGGNRALELVKCGELKAGEVMIFQEDLNLEGFELLKRGAKAQLVQCLESKMYVPHFYDAIASVKEWFKHQLLFEGGTHQLHFPCVDPEDLKRDWPEWSKRKPLCMIASNKQVWSMLIGRNMFSPSFLSAFRNELHSARLRAIEEHDDLDLYGPGWDNLENLPPQWAHLKPKIARQWKGPCADKLETLSQYQYAVCHENTAQPGYITEKMIDCVVVGTKPFYKGPRAFVHDGVDPIIRPKDLHRHTYPAFAETCMKLLDEDFGFDEGFNG